MNEFLENLTLAADHAVKAAVSLVPPRTRRHLRVIGRELDAMLADLFGDPDARPHDDPSDHGTARRIDIEE